MTLLSPGTDIEIINPHVPRGHIPHALFDFDGTVSLIREGWQGVLEAVSTSVETRRWVAAKRQNWYSSP